MNPFLFWIKLKSIILQVFCKNSAGLKILSEKHITPLKLRDLDFKGFTYNESSLVFHTKELNYQNCGSHFGFMINMI